MAVYKCFMLEAVRKEREDFPEGGSITRTVYKRTDTGEEMSLVTAPIGAMVYADWLDNTKRTGPDGKNLIVKTPGGCWPIDQPSFDGQKEGPGWTRTGTPPNVSAMPAIVMGGYHGWLRNGELVDA